MVDPSVNLLGLRLFLSCMGLAGNVVLILSIVQTRFSPLKSFELFLLGLAAANLEEILIVNIYDVIIFESLALADPWSCHSLKFLTIFGEISSILFTVLISVFRYQKLRDGHKRVNLPIYLDGIRAAWTASGMCVLFSALLSTPIFIMNLPGVAVDNSTRNDSSCLPDFFQCNDDHCPTLNRVYKYVFLLTCNLLPLVIVTVNSCLIITVMLSQMRAVTPAAGASRPGRLGRGRRGPRLHRSTVAVLTAMTLFQVDWTIYLVFQLTLNNPDVHFWAEIEFLISTSYTSISPYVYGIGNNLFSLKNFIKK